MVETIEPHDFDIEYLSTLSSDELEKRLNDWNAKETSAYRDGNEKLAGLYSEAAFSAYTAMQRKKNIVIHDPMTREDARRILNTK